MDNCNFNSIKVRLKLIFNSIGFARPKFQFHKGTIKTLVQTASVATIFYFNSIKVRLKRYLSEETLGAIFNFNSIKVRLKLLPSMVIISSMLFQFHKGTIKTDYENCSKADKRNFNSIKVRLKQASTAASTAAS